jgi:hypothetical protein
MHHDQKMKDELQIEVHVFSEGVLRVTGLGVNLLLIQFS